MKKLKIISAITIFAVCAMASTTAIATTALTRQLEAVYRNIKVVVDGNESTLTDVNGTIVEPFIVDGTVYAPIRAISEIYGKYVGWDDENSSVLINTPRGTAPKPGYRDAPLFQTKNATVATPQELADAIAPGMCITLKPGTYDMSTVAGSDNPYVIVRNGMAALTINDVEGLTLRAEPGSNVEIVTPDKFSEVLMFTFCNGVKLSGINAGHSVTGIYECDAGVIFIDRSANVEIADCLFYGSGIMGIGIRDSVSVQVTNTTITDCSLRAVEIWSGNDVRFTGCRFIDNRAYGHVVWGYESSAEFFDCEFSGNRNLVCSVVDFDDDVLFERCVFRDNALEEGSYPVFTGGPIRIRGCAIESAGFDGYWEGGVINLGGNTLS